jgi:Circularly permutated YpsA SLOG family
MKIISGGQSGVDRAALDVAIERGMQWGGWCPKGGWAEDFPNPPGLLPHYPHLRETPEPHPLQRTEWNVRDGDATLVITDSQGLQVSIGTQRARDYAHHHAKPMLIVDATDPHSLPRATTWLQAQRKRFGADLTLGVGGPRESEAPGIYGHAKTFVAALWDRVGA